MSTADAIPPSLEDLQDALEELESAEDFLNHFSVPFDPAVVHVNRLHILQRFHDYLDQAGELPEDPAARYAGYAALLERAYADFVDSDARTEKVFRVFRMHEPRTVNVGLDELLAGHPAETEQSKGSSADHAS